MKTQEEIIDTATADMIRYIEIMVKLSDLDKTMIRTIISQVYYDASFSMLEKIDK